ncbi:MAG: phosphoglucosamine mutase [Micavibrio sp.]|nr:phosphoglucosamine mutase [Micavibrio sp.]
MAKKYFGTDGIRGTANTAPMTAGMVLKVAMATAYVLRKNNAGKPMNRVVIGKDTRLSGYMLEQSMAAGFVAMGMDVIRTGPIPTPAVARLTTTLRADIGVMISASHNPYQDNGIKLFGADGYKFSDDIELQIEAAMDSDLEVHLPSPDDIGKATQLDDASGRYVEYIKRSFPKGQTLEGIKIVIDCANGAAYKVAPQVLWELEAEVIKIGDKPNGRNINDGVGATATQNLQDKVIEEGADIGIALDGDADRLIVVDEKGQRIDGDQIMALLAVMKQRQGFLKNNTIVATVMSNLGLEKFLETQGITLERAAVGDRYVVEKMREGDFNLGGEQSGHIILSDFGTTGDGLLAALQVLSAVKESGKKVSEACHLFEAYPQVLKNVTFSMGNPLSETAVNDAMNDAEGMLAESGRLLVRASGTEPLIRVMAEGQDLALVNKAVDHVCAAVQKVA